MPGAIAAPRNDPSRPTAPNVVAVPKPTTTSGAPKRSRAPSAAAAKSAPSSFGRSVRIAMRSCSAAVKKSGSQPKYRMHASRNARSFCGTTLETTTALTASSGTDARRKSAVNSTPASSAERRRAVVTRQFIASSRAPLADGAK